MQRLPKANQATPAAQLVLILAGVWSVRTEVRFPTQESTKCLYAKFALSGVHNLDGGGCPIIIVIIQVKIKSENVDIKFTLALGRESKGTILVTTHDDDVPAQPMLPTVVGLLPRQLDLSADLLQVQAVTSQTENNEEHGSTGKHREQQGIVATEMGRVDNMVKQGRRWSDVDLCPLREKGISVSEAVETLVVCWDLRILGLTTLITVLTNSSRAGDGLA